MTVFHSGSYAILKTGGPKVTVRWYVDEKHVEVGWYHNTRAVSAIYHEDELELWDDFQALHIDVIDATPVTPDSC